MATHRMAADAGRGRDDPGVHPCELSRAAAADADGLPPRQEEDGGHQRRASNPRFPASARPRPSPTSRLRGREVRPARTTPTRASQEAVPQGNGRSSIGHAWSSLRPRCPSLVVAGGRFAHHAGADGHRRPADVHALYLTAFITPHPQARQLRPSCTPDGMAGFERFAGDACARSRSFATRRTPSTSASPRGEIGVNDVSFSYEGDLAVLHDVSLHDPGRGETVAIVGPSGGGKTHALPAHPALLRRLRPAASRIDGLDVRSVTQQSLRRIDRHRAAGCVPVRRLHP